MPELEFVSAFRMLTGNKPFPWQQALYDEWFALGKVPPSSCNLPTGLGKTSVIAIWLISLASGASVPRRLVYVVNRRTVVDQTTDEVVKYKSANVPGIPDFSVSTLRGQFADNREWSADPSKPAVICGTVDMIGSRLLFSGYGVGMKARPLHAAFLGQDALLVHDEAHLEPAFQGLLMTIEKEQARCKDFRPMRVMELTATSRADGQAFGLTARDLENEAVIERFTASKLLHLHPLTDAKKPQKELVDRALTFRDSGKAVLVFAYSVETVLAVQESLEKAKLPVKTLTGTMRGKERDDLAEDLTFARFLPKPPENSTAGTVYLVCTSAGEVGVNISADHLVCDLSTFESMAQRLGRVNRFGMFRDCEVHVHYPTEWDDKHTLTAPRQTTLELLKRLEGKDASPKALGDIPLNERQAAFAPPPTILPATDILFDAWALTTIKEKLPGRPPVEPYLHGILAWELPETNVAWRREVEEVTGDLLDEYKPADLLEAYPLKPHELLKEPSYRALKHFEAMAKRLAGTSVPVWLVDDDDRVQVTTLKELADKDNKDRIERMTVLLPPSAGGLEGGMLNGAAESANDVADDLFLKDRDGKLVRQRKRVRDIDPNDDPELKEMHEVLTITSPGADEDGEEKVWEWFVLRNEGDKAAKRPVLWTVHVKDVVDRTKEIVANLPLDESLKDAIITAAKLHDHGKKRKLFQRVLGNTDPNVWLAKSGKKGGRVKELYRHEFGSLLDVDKEVTGEHRDLILHLIAAHHGRARPHFPTDEAFDPERSQQLAEDMAMSVPRRFAQLQRKYGRWGLAYLESLLRAADWAASAEPTEFVEGRS